MKRVRHLFVLPALTLIAFTSIAKAEISTSSLMTPATTTAEGIVMNALTPQAFDGPYGPTCGLILGENYQDAQYNCGVASQGAGQLTNCSFSPTGQVSCRCCWQIHF